MRYVLEANRVWVCQRCGSDRVLQINAKCSDRCFTTHIISGGVAAEQDGYVPTDAGLGGDGDYVDMKYCLNCGQIKGTWPLPMTRLEQGGDYS